MTRQQMKAMAKAQLGNQIFGNTWLIAVGVITIQTAISYFVNAIPVAGQVASLLVMGPIAYGVASMFLKQTRTGEKMDIGDIFNGFKDDFSNTFLIGLMTMIFTVLWSLLFIIPVSLSHTAIQWRCISRLIIPTMIGSNVLMKVRE